MVACLLARPHSPAALRPLMTEPKSPPPTPAPGAVVAAGPKAAELEELAALPKDELVRRLAEARAELARLATKPAPVPVSAPAPGPSTSRGADAAARRESILFMRLTAKEQEVQETLVSPLQLLLSRLSRALN